MVVVQKSLQMSINDARIRNPAKIEQINQQYCKFKDKLDDFYNRTNEWVRAGMTDKTLQASLKKEHDEFHKMLGKSEYGKIIAPAIAWKLGVLESYIFSKGKFKLSVSEVAAPAPGLLADDRISDFVEQIFEKIKALKDSATCLASKIKHRDITTEAEDVRNKFASYISEFIGEDQSSKVSKSNVIMYSSEFELFKDYYMELRGASEKEAKKLATEALENGTKKFCGICNTETNTIYLNVERIKNDFGKEYKSQLYVTLVHELMHCAGGFSGTIHDIDSELFNDAICENTADNFVRNRLGMEFEANPYTRGMNSICWKLFGLVGKEKMLAAYVNNDLESVRDDLNEAMALSPEFEKLVVEHHTYLKKEKQYFHFRCLAAMMTEEIEDIEISNNLARTYARAMAGKIFRGHASDKAIDDGKAFYLGVKAASDDETAIRTGFASLMDHAKKPESGLLPIYLDPYLAAILSARIATEHIIMGGNVADQKEFMKYFADAAGEYMDCTKNRIPLRDVFIEQSRLGKTKIDYINEVMDHILFYFFMSNSRRMLPHSVSEIDSFAKKLIAEVDYSQYGQFTDALVEETYRRAINLARVSAKINSNVDGIVTKKSLLSHVNNRYHIHGADADALISLVKEYASITGVSDITRLFRGATKYAEPEAWEILGIIRSAVHNLTSIGYMPPVNMGGTYIYSHIGINKMTGPMLLDYFNIAVEENRIHKNTKTATFCAASANFYIPLGFANAIEI